MHPKAILDRLNVICKKEKVKCDTQSLELISRISDGDMRQAINNLQTCHFNNKRITREVVIKICDIPEPKLFNQIIAHCLNNNSKGAIRILYELIRKGFTSFDIINHLNQFIQLNLDIPEQLRLMYLEDITICYLKLNEGIDSILQLSALICKFCKHKIPMQQNN